MGPAALLPLVFAGFLCFLIALCFAEVGSRFGGTGGAYLYAREAFGGFVGFSVGWSVWWVRVISSAALANAFAVTFLDLFGDARPVPGELVMALVLLLLALANLRGVKAGAILTNVATVAKLVPLALFVLVGLFAVSGDRFVPFAPEGYGAFAETTLLLLWAFVGFEMLAVPAGEMERPGRAVPLALLIVMGGVTILYAGVYVVATGTFAGLAGADNPVARSAGAFLGPVGGGIVAVGIALSVFGTNAGSALVTPRCLYALAEQRQMPEVLARVHPRWRTPAVAIAVSFALSLALALSGSFEQLAVASVVARFAQYLPTCVAVLVLRRRDRRSGRTPASFRLPLGPTVPVLATVLCVGLLTRVEPARLLAGGVMLALGVPFYLVFGRERG
jgi:amino acid transporter